MESYEVTIGIPVYNAEKYIRSAIDSALAQTFESIEFLVLDDCGTDSSMDIICAYKHNHPRGKDIRIVRQPSNLGIGSARNRIVDEAQGKYLYFMDADDIILPNTIQLLFCNAQQYMAEIVYGSYERVELYEDEEQHIPFRYPNIQFIKENEFADCVYSEYGFLQATTWNFLIRRDVYIKNGLKYMALNYWEDFIFTINLPIHITRAVLLPDITYFYYCRNGSLSNFQKRSCIKKKEILQTIDAMSLVKNSYVSIKNKTYFYKWLYKVMKTNFYVCQTILCKNTIIIPPFTNQEIRDVMRSPLSFKEMLGLRGWVVKNMLLFVIGLLHPNISVCIIRLIGKLIK